MNLSVDVYRVKQIWGYLPLNQLKCQHCQIKVFEEISADFYGPLPNGEKLVRITDLHSRFPFIEIMKRTTTVKVIEWLKNLFSIYGYPEKLRHDNGPPFSWHEFKQYLRDVNITDKAITPEHPQSNTLVENFSRTLNKCLLMRRDEKYKSHRIYWSKTKGNTTHWFNKRW